MSRETVVCAVGEHGSPTAVAVAADEAARLDADLHLVHVADGSEATRTGQVLDEAVARVRARHPDLHPTRDPVDRIWIAAGVAEAARGARYVVIERTHRGRLYRLLSGSTAAGVSFKVTAPVLSVPTGWARDPRTPAVVTAAVQDPDEVPTVVGLAATEAVERGADLVVLHAVEDQLRVELAHLQLDRPVQEVLDRHPDLTSRLDVVVEGPADALVDASTRSVLLVAGRRHHGQAGETHLGPVVHRLLLDAVCPVLLPVDEATVATEELAARALELVGTDRRPTPGDVVIGIGEDDAGGAVRFAVAEAVARGIGVHLVHVVRMPGVDGVPLAEVWRDTVAFGRTLLARAMEQAREAGGPQLRITHHLVESGTLVHSLVVEAEGAGVVVVQHRRLGRAARLVTRSVTSGLAARCEAPLVAVPADWSTGPERIGCVVVGVQDVGDATHVLPAALAEARQRAIPLRVVHAGHPEPDERQRLRAEIDAGCRSWPDVRVHRVIEDVDPVDLLVHAVTTAEIVVVGRRSHLLPRRSNLGPVARGVLAESSYPVLLAAPARTAPD